MPQPTPIPTPTTANPVPTLWLAAPSALLPSVHPNPIRPLPLSLSATFTVLILLILTILYNKPLNRSTAPPEPEPEPEPQPTKLTTLGPKIRVLRRETCAPTATATATVTNSLPRQAPKSNTNTNTNTNTSSTSTTTTTTPIQDYHAYLKNSLHQDPQKQRKQHHHQQHHHPQPHSQSNHPLTFNLNNDNNNTSHDDLGKTIIPPHHNLNLNLPSDLPSNDAESFSEFSEFSKFSDVVDLGAGAKYNTSSADDTGGIGFVAAGLKMKAGPVQTAASTNYSVSIGPTPLHRRSTSLQRGLADGTWSRLRLGSEYDGDRTFIPSESNLHFGSGD